MKPEELIDHSNYLPEKMLGLMGLDAAELVQALRRYDPMEQGGGKATHIFPHKIILPSGLPFDKTDTPPVSIIYKTGRERYWTDKLGGSSEAPVLA